MRTAELERDFPEEARSYRTQRAKARADKSIDLHESFKGVGGFKNFLLVMGRKPGPSHTVDRYPNRQGPYAPGNIRWASPTDQTRNRDCTLIVTLNGETLPLAEWCARFRLTYDTVHARVRELGWTPLEALIGRRRSGEVASTAATGTVTTLNPDYALNPWPACITDPADRVSASILGKWRELYADFAECLPWPRAKDCRAHVVFAHLQVAKYARQAKAHLYQLFPGFDRDDPDLPDQQAQHPHVQQLDKLEALVRRTRKMLTPTQRLFVTINVHTEHNARLAAFRRKVGWQQADTAMDDLRPEERLDVKPPVWAQPLWFARDEGERGEWVAAREAKAAVAEAHRAPASTKVRADATPAANFTADTGG